METILKEYEQNITTYLQLIKHEKGSWYPQFYTIEGVKAGYKFNKDSYSNKKDATKEFNKIMKKWKSTKIIM